MMASTSYSCLMMPLCLAPVGLESECQANRLYQDSFQLFPGIPGRLACSYAVPQIRDCFVEVRVRHTTAGTHPKLDQLSFASHCLTITPPMALKLRRHDLSNKLSPVVPKLAPQKKSSALKWQTHVLTSFSGCYTSPWSKSSIQRTQPMQKQLRRREIESRARRNITRMATTNFTTKPPAQYIV